MNISEDNKLLFARLDDLCRRSGHGEPGISCFLSPRELYFSQLYLEQTGMAGRYVPFGGYEGAERQRLFVLPEYMEGTTSYDGIHEYFGEEHFGVIRVDGSGYRALSHRDYLGSVLSLGLRRDVIGDIIVYEDPQPYALIVCEHEVTDFILSELVRIGNDKVRTSEYELPDGFAPERRFEKISDTVASARADCVVAALCNISREKAREAVVCGIVEINYETEQRPDRTVAENSVIGIRGYGKFRINSLSVPTKKGRLVLSADKYK